MASKTWLLVWALLTVTANFAFVSLQDNVADCSRNGTDTGDLYTLISGVASKMEKMKGFYNASKGKTNVIAACRADVEPERCVDCIEYAANQILWQCGNKTEAILWKELCVMRYSSESILGKLALEPHYSSSSLCSPKIKEDKIQLRRSLLDKLRDDAVNGRSPLKAAAENRNLSKDVEETIYAMVQCMPDLSRRDCNACLADGIQQISDCCTDYVGVKLYKPSCTIRVDVCPFYNITRLEQVLNPSTHSGIVGSKVFIIVVALLVFLIVALFVGLFLKKGTMKKKEGEPKAADGISNIDECRSYDFGEIDDATQDFFNSNKPGESGVGVMYKGKLKDGREITVKKLSNSSQQEDERQFKNEVNLRKSLQHRNLVRLCGFSKKGVERFLIYEPVENESLDHFIFDPTKSADLDWDTRYKIITGIAKGLYYLHEDSRIRIIHCNLKASNVLLDKDLDPKISDFGNATPFKSDASSERVPEDIYSFGVLILEIVSGRRKQYDQSEGNPGELKTTEGESNWLEEISETLIDPVLRAKCGVQEDMLRCIHIALLCVQQNKKKRPNMGDVLKMLSSPTLVLPSELEFSESLVSQGEKQSMKNLFESSPHPATR